MQETILKLFVKAKGLKDALIQDERGQDLIEYALVVALIALGTTVVMGTFATTVGNSLTSVGTKLTNKTS